MRPITVILLLLTGAILADASTQILAASADENRTMIVADQQHGVVSVIINGKEAAWFDNAGLHVKESVEFGGTLTDTGTAYLDQHARDHSAPK